MASFNEPGAFGAFYRSELVPFWRGYGVRPDRKQARELFRSTDGQMDRTYIPEDIWVRYIVPFFNDPDYALSMGDANFGSLIGRDLRRPETLFKRMGNGYCLDDFAPITREKAIALCRTPGEWAVRPSRPYTRYEADALYFTGADRTEDVASILRRFDREDYIVQRRLRPWTAFSDGVVIVKLTTLLRREQASLLSAVLEYPEQGAAGRRVCRIPIRPDGTLGAETVRIGPDGIRRSSAPKTLPEAGAFAAAYRETRTAALTLAFRSPYTRLTTWSFAVAEDGGSVYLGFDALAPAHHQEVCGAAFGDRTEEILVEVFARAASTCAVRRR